MPAASLDLPPTGDVERVVPGGAVVSDRRVPADGVRRGQCANGLVLDQDLAGDGRVARDLQLAEYADDTLDDRRVQVAVISRSPCVANSVSKPGSAFGWKLRAARQVDVPLGQKRDRHRPGAAANA